MIAVSKQLPCPTFLCLGKYRTKHRIRHPTEDIVPILLSSFATLVLQLFDKQVRGVSFAPHARVGILAMKSI